MTLAHVFGVRGMNLSWKWPNSGKNLMKRITFLSDWKRKRDLEKAQIERNNTPGYAKKENAGDFVINPNANFQQALTDIVHELRRLKRLIAHNQSVNQFEIHKIESRLIRQTQTWLEEIKNERD